MPCFTCTLMLDEPYTNGDSTITLDDYTLIAQRTSIFKLGKTNQIGYGSQKEIMSRLPYTEVLICWIYCGWQRSPNDILSI